MSKTITLNVSDENYKFLQEYAAINQQSVEDWICSLLFQSEDATCALPLEIQIEKLLSEMAMAHDELQSTKRDA